MYRRRVLEISNQTATEATVVAFENDYCGNDTRRW